MEAARGHGGLLSPDRGHRPRRRPVRARQLGDDRDHPPQAALAVGAGGGALSGVTVLPRPVVRHPGDRARRACAGEGFGRAHRFGPAGQLSAAWQYGIAAAQPLPAAPAGDQLQAFHPDRAGGGDLLDRRRRRGGGPRRPAGRPRRVAVLYRRRVAVRLRRSGPHPASGAAVSVRAPTFRGTLHRKGALGLAATDLLAAPGRPLAAHRARPRLDGHPVLLGRGADVRPADHARAGGDHHHGEGLRRLLPSDAGRFRRRGRGAGLLRSGLRPRRRPHHPDRARLPRH